MFSKTLAQTVFNCASGQSYDTQMAQCRTSCNPNSPSCSTGICNPITATCEPTCQTSLDCQNIFGQPYSGNQICVKVSGASTGYCAATCDPNNTCSGTFSSSSNFVCSRGMCLQSSSVAGKCPTNLIPDNTSGGCGIACAPGDTCSGLTFPTGAAGCSLYSGTCVPQATAATPTATCTFTAEAKNLVNLCEMPCASTCSAPGAVCVNSICQIGCKTGGSCINSQQQCVAAPNPSNNSCQYIPVPANNICPPLTKPGAGSQSSYCVPFSCSTPCTENTPTCVNDNTCGCASNTCPSGSVCNSAGNGTCGCPTSCPSGESCQGIACACDSNACSAQGGTCDAATTKCQIPCGGKFCLASQVCANGANCYPNAPAGSGVPGSEPGGVNICDEGSLGITCSTDNNCPNGFFCPTGGGICTPSKPCSAGCPIGIQCEQNTGLCKLPQDAAGNKMSRGNGLNGHCSLSGKKICAILVTLPNLAQVLLSQIWTQWPANLKRNSLSAAVSKIGTTAATGCPPGYLAGNDLAAGPDSDCPCGYGIWVSNGTDSNIPVTVTVPMNIYGGFSGSETSIYDRQALNLNIPLGEYAPSGTILGNNNSSILSVGAGTAPVTLTLDGFQILGGNSNTSSSQVCGTQQPAGGVTICSQASVTLQNVRVAKNTTTQNGGGIRNLGTLKLRDSMVSLNTAGVQGGGISHESTNSTIERVEFYGNGFNATTLRPIWTAGSAPQPTGWACPTLGGLCNPATPVPTPPCPVGYYAPASAPTTCLPGVSTLGGAIAAIGATGTLSIYASKFNGNYSYANGGAIYTSQALDVESSIFTDNWASNSGGGIYLASGATTSTLQNLTFVDNSAYNQGGAGIFDAGTSSKITSSLLRNNLGLLPYNGSVFEWLGNRPPLTLKDANYWQFNISSISSIMGYAATTMQTGSNTSFSASYVDICPITAYTPLASPPSAGGYCDGTETCGPWDTKAPTTQTSGVSFNLHGGTSNGCARTDSTPELVSCAFPTYTFCAPNAGMAITDQLTSSFSYPFDLSGAPIGTTSLTRGAYQ